jgi:hypothetical protein
MYTIKINVSRMFHEVEPCYVSGSAAELGKSAGQITWRNAQTIGARGIELHVDDPDWLLSPVAESADSMRDWAVETGAWEREEVELWHDSECLALLAQNVAHELRLLGSDEHELTDLAAIYAETDWEHESEYPTGSYYLSEAGDLMCDFYTGV